MRKMVDLSHEVEHGMVTYPGLPAPEITDHLSREASAARYAEGVQFQIGKIEMVANTGTYLDTPFHRYEKGFDLHGLPLSSVAGLEGVLVDCRDVPGRGIESDAFSRFNVKGKAVLFYTGWDKRWRTPEYGSPNPFITRSCSEALVKSGAVLVGIDSINIDDLSDLERPAHSILLKNNIPIVEHLCNLDQLLNLKFQFFAVPPKVIGFGTFPVRAFAIVD